MYWYPILNQARCSQCHGSIDHHPVNGLLVVDFLPNASALGLGSTLLLTCAAMGSLVLFALIMLMTLRRQVSEPLSSMAQTAEALVRQHTRPLRSMMSLRRADGSTVDVDIDAAPLTMEDGSILVIEVLRPLERSLRFSQQQRLSTLGLLANGVAHEIHNPLASIRIALQASLRGLRKGKMEHHELVGYLELVDHEIDRCVMTTQRMMQMSQLPAETLSPVNLTCAVDDVLALLREECRIRGVHVSIEDWEPPPHRRAVPLPPLPAGTPVTITLTGPNGFTATQSTNVVGNAGQYSITWPAGLQAGSYQVIANLADQPSIQSALGTFEVRAATPPEPPEPPPPNPPEPPPVPTAPQAVPALSPLGLIGLSSLLALLGFMRRRRS